MDPEFVNDSFNYFRGEYMSNEDPMNENPYYNHFPPPSNGIGKQYFSISSQSEENSFNTGTWPSSNEF